MDVSEEKQLSMHEIDDCHPKHPKNIMGHDAFVINEGTVSQASHKCVQLLIHQMGLVVIKM